MTDHAPSEKPAKGLDDLQNELEAADAADAPSIAEELAATLGSELEGDAEGPSH